MNFSGHKLDYIESAEMLPNFSNEDKIVLYSIIGGSSEHLSRIDSKLSVKENIQDLFFNPFGRLFEEPLDILKQEFEDYETYDIIIAAIAEGSNRLNEIVAKIEIEPGQCSEMLASLISLGLIREECPVAEAVTSPKAIYLINDSMFKFWYRFVRPDISRIIMGLGDKVCDEVFERYLAMVSLAKKDGKISLIGVDDMFDL